MKKHRTLITALFLIAAILAGILTSGFLNRQRTNSVPVTSGSGSLASDTVVMEVHFLDVGQGDSTLITCDGHAMLIDAADDSQGTAIWNYLKKQKVDKLDYLVLTHPDSDHIGGAPVIITKFEIDQVFVSNFEKDNQTYRKLIQSLDDRRLKYAVPEVGSTYPLGSASLTFLAPVTKYDDPNNSSIALLLQNGANRFLFTGDAQEKAEQDILATGLDISADVYKAGHHGSRTSTSEDFFHAVSPTCAVISCGEGNSYGHPHAQTLNTFRMNGVSVYRTDEDGVIIATSDGSEITFNVPASESWKAGEPGRVSTGNSQSRSEKTVATSEAEQNTFSETTWILNTKSKKFHRPTCDSLPAAKNRQDSTDTRESIISQGYEPCGRCKP